MKRIFELLLMVAVLFLSYAMSAQAVQETYTLDPQHTHVLWHINHLGFSNQAGKWYAEGTLTLDQAKPQNSSVMATIHIADIITGIKELDKHLMSDLFFDVAKFPNATFASDKVTVTGKSTAKVQGVLTLHGVSKPVVLNVKLNKIGVHPISNKEAVGFSANTKIKRSDFGISTLPSGLGDEVTINIEAEAFKAK